MTQMQRAMIDLPDRQVHYRYGGSGPVVVLLHQSPQNSRALLPIAEQLTDTCTVILPDTPGFGLSDPLNDPNLQITDLSFALHEVVTALGLERFAVFGQHTGGLIALQYALEHPQRVSGVVIDGLAAFTREESAFILANYLTEFQPSWDGSHLAWLWARLREQLIFFPWHDARLDARLAFSIPPAAYLHQGVLDFLYAGDHYRAGYGAAFRYHDAHRVAELGMPTHILLRGDDPLAEHAARLPELPDHVRVEMLAPGLDAMQARACECLRTLSADGRDTWHHCEPLTPNDFPRRRFVNLGDTQVSYREFSGGDKPLALVHNTADSADRIAPLARFITGHHVFMPDLPGCGESQWAGDLPDWRETAELLRCALPETAGADCAWVGFGGGGALALNAAEASQQVIAIGAWQLEQSQARSLAERYTLAVEPDEYGNHLLRLWQQIRDARLFFPWYETNAAHRRMHEPDIEPADLHLAFFDALKAANHRPQLWQQRFTANVPTGASEKVQLLMRSNEANPVACAALAKTLGLGEPQVIAPDNAATGASIAALLA